MALRALQEWSDIIGVNFVEQAGGAQITFDDLEQGTGAFANAVHANGIISSAIVNVSLQRLNLHTYMHEIGHALGLGHTSNSNAGTAAAVYPIDALWSNDSSALSIMSYFDNIENGYYASRGFSHLPIMTPQVADMLAIGNLYGLSTTTRTGNTTYGFNNSSGNDAYDAVARPNVAYTIFDSAGVDTLDYSGFAANQLIDLNPEAFSNIGGWVGNVVIARGTTIENAVGGSGSDRIIGNAAANLLIGNGGDDILSGHFGNDVLVGGSGNDQFLGTAAGHSGDTISDLSIGDRIVFTDANLASFTFSLAGSTLTYSGGSMTLAGVTGHLTARAEPGGGVALALAVPTFASPVLVHAAYGTNASAGNWTSDDRYPRMLSDIDGDGRVDIVGFGEQGVYVSLGLAGGSFGAMTRATVAFGAGSSSGGWSSNEAFPRMLGDVNGDGRDDIVGFGNAGAYVSLANSDGTFGAPSLALAAFGASASAGGWSSNDLYLRRLADVNGDGRADIVGFGNDGVFVALAGPGGAFAAPTLATTAFGAAPNAGGWASDDRYPRHVADVNGDGRADIVGFGNEAVLIAFGNADGTFSAPIVGLRQFGASSAAGGWTSDNLFPRRLGDVNDDGRVDIVGFGNDGAFVALGNGDGTFQSSTPDLRFFGLMPSAGGWSSNDLFPRHLAEVDGDGAADVVGFASTGVYVALATNDLFA